MTAMVELQSPVVGGTVPSGKAAADNFKEILIVRVTLCADGTILLTYRSGRLEAIKR